jgi:divalent metal cation (Fe/Co/Zn/Cd) transporter
LSLPWLFEGGAGSTDPLFSLVLVAVRGHDITILAPNVLELLVGPPEEELQPVILRDLAASFEGHENFDGFQTRLTGTNVHTTLRLEFVPERLMGEAQGVLDRMRARLEVRIPAAQVVIAPISRSSALTGKSGRGRFCREPLTLAAQAANLSWNSA